MKWDRVAHCGEAWFCLDGGRGGIGRSARYDGELGMIGVGSVGLYIAIGRGFFLVRMFGEGSSARGERGGGVFVGEGSS